MKNNLIVIQNSSNLTCLWVPTGNSRNPLACVWVEERQPKAGTNVCVSIDEGRMHRCA
jgi:hypothetical protein